MENDWISWSGGECPVPPDTLVDVMLRLHSFIPYKIETSARAGDLYWYTDKSGYPVDKPFSPYNIVSYRLSKESGQKPVSGDAGCTKHPEFTPTVPSEAHHSGDAPTWRDQVALEFAKSRILTGKSYVLNGLVETSYAFADLMIAERGKKNG